MCVEKDGSDRGPGKKQVQNLLKGHFTNFERVTFFSSLIERMNTLEGFFILRSLKGVMDKIRLLQRVPEHKTKVFPILNPLRFTPRYHNVKVVFFPC